METKSGKLSWILLFIVSCVTIIIAFVLLFVPAVFIANEFQSFTGHQWSDFKALNPQVASYIAIASFDFGIALLVTGISALFITLFAYRKGEKWAWYLLLIAHTIGWGGAISANLLTGDMVVVTVCIVFLVIAYVGLAIAGKAILKKVSA